MAETTEIAWTDSTWSPWEGCTKVSPGCDHCYAEGMNRWLRKGENWGPGAPRRIYSEDHWDKPVKWQRDALKFETLHNRRRRVFPSVCDPFDNEALPILRERLWGLIRLTPAIDWLLLTKRIGNAKSMLPADWGDGYPNVWLGATVVNQEEADRDIPKLLATPARVRFLSIEPMLGPIDLRRIVLHSGQIDLAEAAPPEWHGIKQVNIFIDATQPGKKSGRRAIDWVICGGESGHGARPAHPDWFRSLRDQCAAAGVPFLFKQWGEWLPVELPSDEECYAEDGSERAFEGRIAVQRGPQPMGRVGKKAAGRLLDGVEHNGLPAP